jgi:hypothetical protein
MYMSLMAAYTYANLDEDLLRTENQSPAQLRIESVAIELLELLSRGAVGKLCITTKPASSTCL